MSEDEDIEEELEETREQLQGMIEGIQSDSNSNTEKQEEESGSKEPDIKLEDCRNEEGKFVDPDTGEEFDTKKGFRLYIENIK